MEQLAKWLDGEPEVPGGLWYKRFSAMTACGEGELILAPATLLPAPDKVRAVPIGRYLTAMASRRKATTRIRESLAASASHAI